MKSEERSENSAGNLKKNPPKVSKILAQILQNRGIREENFAEFLNPKYEDFAHDPFLFPDMKKAVVRIKKAKKLGEKITIYGDYDIDGMTATVILWESLRKFGLEVATYTPDRFTEGYGLNCDAISKIAKDGAKLIITVDNGTLSFDEIAFAKKLGLDVIVTDHHSPHADLPDAAAILNPKVIVARNPEFYDEKFCLKKDWREILKDNLKNSKDKNFTKKYKITDKNFEQKICSIAQNLYPFCDLCGAGVAFKLAQALQIDSLKNAENFAKFEKKIAKNLEENLKKTAEEKNQTVQNFAEKLPKNSRKKSEKSLKSSKKFGEKSAQKIEEIEKNPHLIPLANGQEKWFLDLVALGTVCDIVGLVDENRANVKWGIEVMKKTRRAGIRALVAAAGANLAEIDARTLGFVIGPRLNAAGRLETAEMALELLKLYDTPNDILAQEKTNARALELALKLNELNKERREIQNEIFAEACKQIENESLVLDENSEKNRAENSENSAIEQKNCSDISEKNCAKNNFVAIAVGDDWHEGVIGIVAAKILEKFEKPAFVFSRGKEFSKASGRSFGDFSCAEVIRATGEIIEKGGGHLAAGGLTVKNENLEKWKIAAQNFYKKSVKNPEKQREFLYPKADLNLANFAEIDQNLLGEIKKLEPFGNANEAPVFTFFNLLILSRKTMGKNNEHVKYVFSDKNGAKFTAVNFGGAEKFKLENFDENGEITRARILVELSENVWNGRVSVEGKLIKMCAEES